MAGSSVPRSPRNAKHLPGKHRERERRVEPWGKITTNTLIDADRDRQTDRQSETKTNRQSARDRERDGLNLSENHHKHTDRQTDRQSETKTDRQTDRARDRVNTKDTRDRERETG